MKRTLWLQAILWALALGACKSEPFKLAVVFPETGGLKPGDNVTIRGLAVGQVSDVDLHPEGVVARLEIQPRFVAHLDQQAVFAIADEKLVTGKRMLTVTPGGGPPLTAGATVKGAPVPRGALDQVKDALDDSVAQVGDQVKGLGRDLLHPDRAPPRALGGTVDLDRPGRFALELLSVKVFPTTADGSAWDPFGGDPDLLVQVWVGERQVLLAGPVDGALEASWEGVVSAPFELGQPIRIKVLDRDSYYNDEIGVVALEPAASDLGRSFRLAAGRIEALNVRLRAAEEPTE